MVVDIDGQKYYPLYQFAEMTCRSVSTIRHLMFTGNKIRKLQYKEEPAGRYYIPVEEYTEFPFTSSGRYASDKVYKFTPSGAYELLEQYEIAQLYAAEGKEYIVKEKRHGKAHHAVNS